MSINVPQELVHRWIERYTKAMFWAPGTVLQRQDLYPEVEDALDALYESDPNLVWEFIMAALRTNQTEEVMAALGSRLVLLLEAHPEQFVERAESQAQHDPLFKELLSWLLPSNPSSEYWSRIRKAAGEVLW